MGTHITASTRTIIALGLGLIVSAGLAPQAVFAQGQGQSDEDGAGRGGRGGGGFGQRGGGGIPGLMGGQGGMGAFGGNMAGPYYVERDLPFFVTHLQLDTPQRMVLEIALQDYLKQHQDATDRMRAEAQALRPERTEEDNEARQVAREQMRELAMEMRELRSAMAELQAQSEASQNDTRVARMSAELQARLDGLQQEMVAMRETVFDASEMQQRIDQMMAVFENISSERKLIEAKFKADVQALLNDDQWAYWPDFEQFMRRQKTMRLGRLSGESVDLFNIVRDMNIDTADAEREIEPLLDEYARQLDTALIARNDHLERASEQTRTLLQNRDVDAAMKLAGDESSSRMRVRDVNRTFAELISGSMKNRELAAEFLHNFNEQAFGRIWRPTMTQRAIEQALAFDGLDAVIVDAIASLQQAYLLELNTHNQALQRLTVSEEPRDIIERVERMAARFTNDGGGGGGRFQATESPLREAFTRRDQTDHMYRMMLEELLSPEHIAQLPQPRQRGQRGQQGGNNQQIMQQFDKDGDGQLNAEEREAIRQYMQQLEQNAGGEGQGRRGRGNRGNNDN